MITAGVTAWNPREQVVLPASLPRLPSAHGDETEEPTDTLSWSTGPGTAPEISDHDEATGVTSHNLLLRQAASDREEESDIRVRSA